MDSDLLFILDRPHITYVDVAIFRSLLSHSVRGEGNALNNQSPKKRKIGGNITPEVKNVNRPGITLLKRSLELGILFSFPNNDNDSDSDVSANATTAKNEFDLIDPSFKLDYPVNITNVEEDPTRFLVSVAENILQPVEENEKLNGDKKRTRKQPKSNAKSTKFIPPFLLELQITKSISIISNEIALLRQILTSSKSLKASQIFKKIESPTLSLQVESINRGSREITFKGSINYSLVIEDSADALYAQTTQSPAMRLLFAYLLNNETYLEKNARNLEPSVDPPLFYNIICSQADKNSPLKKSIKVNGLESSLLRYQNETVRWCLRKEGKDLIENIHGEQEVIDLDPEVRDYVVSPPPGWSKLVLPTPQDNDKELWINPYLGCVCKEETLRTTISEQMSSLEQYCGKGLLAEEMGLGKTVEIIALLLLNQRRDIVREGISVKDMEDIPVSHEVPVKEEISVKEEAGEVIPPPTSESSDLSSTPAITPYDRNLVYDYFLGRTVTKAKTTLVITPASIRTQWVEELNKHAPSLSVYIYKGLKGGRKYGINEDTPTAEELAKFDVVITTYRVIATEMHFAFYRAAPGREYLESPLVQLQFWRVILDEVQMVNSGVSNAAKVARIIPRVHAWGVTGTPVKKDMTDLQGILIFLRIEPFASWNKIWSQLLATPNDFEELFSKLSIRHTTSMLEDDLSIPAQRRVLLSIPFTPVEENNYQHLYRDMLKECSVDEQGNFTEEVFDPVKLTSWLVRLRQACCHARIGMGNRRALGGGPLRTIEDVLDAMYEQATTSLLSDQRRYFTLLLERGQLLEKQHEPEKALELWTETMEGVLPIVEELRKEEQTALKMREEREKERLILREQRRKEREKERLKLLEGIDREMTVTSTPFSESDFENEEEEEEIMDDNDIKLRKLRLRSWVELLHRCYFFVASGNFQMYHEPGDDGANDEQRQLTDEEKNYQSLEQKYYNLAELLRRELLVEPTQKVHVLTEKLNSRVTVQQFVTLDDATINDRKVPVGLESRQLLASINQLGQCLNGQADLIDTWREEVIGLLSKSLLDKDADPDGEEYGESLDAQEYAFSYLEVLQQVLSDRTEAISGTPDPTIMEKVTMLEGVKSEFQEKLEKERNDIRPIQGAVPGSDNFEYSMAGYLSQIRSLSSTLSGSRGSMEAFMLKNIKSKVQKIYTEQRKELKNLVKEVSFFSDLYNARVEYYRQLQEISDNVVAIDIQEEKEIKKQLKKKEKEGMAVKKMINQQTGRQKYLSSLRSIKQMEQPKVESGTTSVDKVGVSSEEDVDRLCVICQCTFYIGALTVCGHQYCRECLQEWWRLHNTCPVCKRILAADEVYNFSYRRKDVEMTQVIEEEQDEANSSMNNGIYSLAGKKSVSEIRSMPLSSNYGSKIDFIIQHLLWLKHLDKTTQVVVFSQWTEMLDLLKSALDDHYIEYASVNSRMDEFKRNPEITCFLLHAKAES